MHAPGKTQATRYGMAVGAVALATVVRLLLDPLLGEYQIPFITFFVAVAVAARYGGLAPALLAVVLSTLPASYYFIAPRGSLLPGSLTGWLSLVIFTAVGSALAIFSQQLRWAREEAEQNAQRRLQERERFFVTLSSIGDAVIVTDEAGRVSFLNAVAEQLTGWSDNEASGRPLDEVFRIVDEKTRTAAANPAQRALAEGKIVGLANHTLLVAKNGEQRAIDDSAAPILAQDGTVCGVVLVFRDVTARRQAEIERSRLAALVDSSEDAVIGTTLDGIITDWNPEAERLFGYAASESVGRPIVELIVPPDRRDELQAALECVQRGARVEPFATLRRSKRGELIPVSIRISPIYDAEGAVVGVSAIDRDIRQTRAAERRRNARLAATQILAQQEDVRTAVRSVLEAVCTELDWETGAIWTIDEARGVLRCRDLWRRADSLLNPFEQTTRGIALERGVGLPGHIWASQSPAWVRDVVQDGNFPRAAQAEQAGLHGAFGCPVRVDGEFFGAIEFFCREIQEPDEDLLELVATLGGQLGQFIERRRAEDQLRRSRAELQEANQRKDEFLAMLGHELRNPLAPIRSGLDVLALEAGGQNETVALMQEQIEHLVRLVDDLLDVSRIIRGKIELRKEHVELGSILRRAVAAVRPAVESQQQELVVSGPEEPIWLDADPVRLLQVAENLLNNASKYSDRGSRIELCARREGNEALFSVRDNGIGIEPDLLPKVFDWFVQSSRSYHRAQGGLGLGLTLVQNLVQLHGGTVTAHSDGPGHGSEFLVRLPTVEAAAETPFAAPAAPVAPLPSTAPARRILIVDDNVGAARTLSLLLAGLGPHEIEVAGDGPAALAVASRFQPELVLLDIGMPGMSGHEVAQALRQTPECAHALLVAVTGYGQDDDRRRSREAGFDEHLTKPPSRESICALLTHRKLNGRSPSAPTEPPLAVSRAEPAAVPPLRASSHDERLGAFLRELAHDVGNALHPFQLIVQILRQPQLDPAMLERLRKAVESQMPSLERLLRDVRRVSAIVRGALELSPHPVDLAPVLRNSAESARPGAEAKQIRVETEIPDCLPQVHADPGRIEQALEELLANAIRSTAPGGEIRLSARVEREQLSMEVRDSGAGIPRALLPHVFELFVVGDQQGRLSGGHFGVGLALVRQIAEKHGGAVEAESAGPGQGSRFTLRIPLPP